MEPINSENQQQLYLTKKQRVKQFQSTAESASSLNQRCIQQQLQLQQLQMQQQHQHQIKMHNAHFQMLQEQRLQQQLHHQRSFTFVPKENTEFNNTTSAIDNLGSVMNTLVNSRLAQLQAQQFVNQSNPFSFPSQTRLPSEDSCPSPVTTAKSSYTDESKCHVCGDKSTGSHFGGISCESCKAFFRRSVQKNRFEDYKCSYTGECKMNMSTRKVCQFCRYKSCLLIGMKTKWVLSDDERHQKYGNRRKQKRKDIIDPRQDNSNVGMPPSKEARIQPTIKTPSSATETTSVTGKCTDRCGSDDDYSNDTRDSQVKSVSSSNGTEKTSVSGEGWVLKRVTSDCVNKLTYELSNGEKAVVDRLSMAFYHSRRYNAIDLNIQKKLGMLLQSQTEATLKKMAKVILANFIVQPVKRVITFAKLITDFKELDIDDQLTLLQGGTMEIFICSSSSLYDSAANKFENVISKERKISGNDQSNIQLDILRLIWSDEIFFETIRFLKSMHELDIDEATLILILPLILFSPDRPNLINKKRVTQLQGQYSLILKKYMIWKYGKPHTNKLFPVILLKLIELRTLHVMHSSILLDADKTQLGPFPLALFFNKESEPTQSPATNDVHDSESPVTDEDSPKLQESEIEYEKIPAFSFNSNEPLNHNSSVLTPDSIMSTPLSSQPSYNLDSLNNSDLTDSLHNQSLNLSDWP